MKSRHLNYVLSLLCLLLTATTASAYSFESDGIYYNKLTDTTCAVAAPPSTSDYTGAITIPSTVTISETTNSETTESQEYTVTEIAASAFKNCSEITAITIPSTITKIAGASFNGCSGLLSLTIEDSEEPLELGCNTWIRTPYTGAGLFASCPLENIYVGRNLSYDSSGNAGYGPFYGKAKLTKLTVSDNVTSISVNEFRNCTALETVSLPNTITEFGEYAFLDDTALITINIPKDITTINQCLQNCSALAELTIPAAVVKIDNYAFNGCSSLAKLTIEDSDTVLKLGYNVGTRIPYTGSGLFASCPLETVYIGRNLDYESDGIYGYSPFWKRTKLTTVEVSNSVTEIKENEFRDCSALINVTLPGTIQTIKDAAFSGCTSLVKITIPGSVTSVESLIVVIVRE